MNPADLEKLPLKDIHLPEEVSWFPPAPGWWILLFCIFIAVLGYLFYRHYKNRRRLRQEALSLLNMIKLDFDQHADPVRYLNELSVLYRRLALTLYPRNQVAGLNGQAWLDFINKVAADAGAHDVYFNSSLAELLLTQQYQKSIRHDKERFEQLYQLSQKWISSLPLKIIKPETGKTGLLRESA